MNTLKLKGKTWPAGPISAQSLPACVTSYMRPSSRAITLNRAEGNLGSLTRLLDEPPDLQTPAISPNLLPISGEPRFDFLAIFSSTVLLVILLAILFERILGLDKLLANFLRRVSAKRAAERRRRLERSYNRDDED